MKTKERRPTRKPNVVLIVLDTVRADRLGYCGYSRNTSPNLDRFAEGAIAFDNAIAPAQWTVPSHASMFTGEAPSTHMTNQGGDILDNRFTTLAEHLRLHGYYTVGFCNNPLVGVINNGLKRGFETFYNYGGAFPSRPVKPNRRVLGPLGALWERYTQILRKISYPIQNAFNNSARLFGAALNPFWVPLWTRFTHFKGDTVGSIEDVVEFVAERPESDDQRPYFLFFNLMETHLPYSTPDRFVKQFAPQLQEDREAIDFLMSFNQQAKDWITPLDEPFTEKQAKALSDMYDAEIAYEDHLMGELYALLNSPERQQDTQVIVVADHGEMLGEHSQVGHTYGVRQGLIHVPLVVRSPGQVEGHRVSAPVSITRLFHTVLEAIGVETYETNYSPAVDVKSHSLLREVNRSHRPQPVVYCEAYCPEYAYKVLESHRPQVARDPIWRATHRAAYEGTHKLINIEEVRDELFAIQDDPGETSPLTGTAEMQLVEELLGRIESFVEKAASRRPRNWKRRKLKLDNEVLRKRLRDLGYIE